jgi:glycosyltransferase involved in cell wall biosynthesis
VTAPRVLQLLGPSTGGIRRHVAYLTAHLREAGWPVAVAGPQGALDEIDHVVPIPKRDRPLRTLQARAALAPLLAEVDLVHAHGLKPALITSLIRNRPKLVVSVHNLVLDEVSGRAAPALRWLEGRLPARADATIAISDGVAARFAGVAGGDRIRVVPPAGPPPTPTRTPEAVRAELGVGAGEDLVVTPARLTPQKGLLVLLDAAEQVRRSRPGLRWFVFGEGWLRPELEEAIERRGLAGTVHLAGLRPDVDSELAAADAVVVTSQWESGPLVLLEAVALGRPVVSTDVGLARSVVEPPRGRVVPVGDAGALAAALVEVLERGEDVDRVGHPTPSRFSPPALAAEVEAVYRDVLGLRG